MVDYHTHVLSDSKQLNSIAKSVFSCIDVIYKVSPLFYFQRERY